MLHRPDQGSPRPHPRERRRHLYPYSHTQIVDGHSTRGVTGSNYQMNLTIIIVDNNRILCQSLACGQTPNATMEGTDAANDWLRETDASIDWLCHEIVHRSNVPKIGI